MLAQPEVGLLECFGVEDGRPSEHAGPEVVLR